jgi:hypothetical protein
MDGWKLATSNWNTKINIVTLFSRLLYNYHTINKMMNSNNLQVLI